MHQGHLQLLRRMIPHLHFEIIFDVPTEPCDFIESLPFGGHL
ncbi:hypothetical protein [Lyngbya aestuarii]